MEKEINDIEADHQLAELTGLPPSFFEENKKNYLKNIQSMLTGIEQDSLIILQGGNEIPRFDTDVVHYHFQQEANFYYLTGVREPQCYAVLDVKSGFVTIYITLSMSDRDRVFMQIPTLKELTDKYALTFREMNNFYSDFKVRKPSKIYVLSGVNSDSKSHVVTAKLDFPHDVKEYQSKVDNNPLIYEILADTRSKKTNEEIKLLKYISKTTVEGHIQTIKSIKPGMYERDAENTFFNYMRKNHYVRIWDYSPICGCGANSATLHYTENDRIIKENELILMDMGVRVAGYCSDVTSTVPVNGKFTPRQKLIYQTVLNATKLVINKLKPGIYWPDMHVEAERVILQGLVDHGILSKDFSVEDMIKDRIGYYFMPHGLGHLMGLEVHDVGGYLSFTPSRIELPGLSSLRTARYLSVGNVITVEPGIYFIPFLLDKALADENVKKYFIEKELKTYYDFGGVRIEDDIVITVDGCVNMTKNLPREIDEIEDLMK